MNSSIKKLCLTVFCAFLAFCAFFTLMSGVSVNTAKADGAAVTETTYNFTMEDGVQAKIADFESGAKRAIRFVTKLDGSVDLSGKKVVTIITLAENLENAEIATDEDFKLENLADVKFSTVVFSGANGNIPEVKDGYYTFNACIYNIKDENYTKKFAARSYITDENGLITQYTDFDITKNAVALWDVANEMKSLAEYEDMENCGPDKNMTAKDYLSTLCKEYTITAEGFDSATSEIKVKHGQTLNDYISKVRAFNVEGVAYVNENAEILSEMVTADKESLELDMFALAFALNSDGETYSVSKGTYGNAGQGVVRVPATYNSATVKSVAAAGFGVASDGTNNSWLTKIILPDTVTSIGNQAFRRCVNLNYVQCRGVVALNNSAQFYACNNLKTLVVGARTFIDDEWDTEIKANYGQASIYHDTSYTVQGDAYLSVDKGSTLFCDADKTGNVVAKIYKYSKTFDWGCFCYDENGDVKSYNEDSYATYAGSANSFNAPTDAQVVAYSLNSNGTGYIANASMWLSKVMPEDGVVKIPESYNGKDVVALGNNVFNENKKIKKLILPSTVKTVGNQFIRKCTSLTYLDMCGVTTSFDISNKAYLCTALTAIVIGPDIGRLGRDFQCDSATQSGKASVFFNGTLEEFDVMIGASKSTEYPYITISNKVYLYSKTAAAGCFYYDEETGIASPWDENSYYTYTNGALTLNS